MLQSPERAESVAHSFAVNHAGLLAARSRGVTPSELCTVRCPPQNGRGSRLNVVRGVPH